MRLTLCLASLTLFLAGCSGASDDSGNATSISIRSDDGDGNVAIAAADGDSGEFSIETPVFNGAIKLPKLHLDADDFDLNGVALYPGSTISGINVDARDKGDDSRVHVAFESPAAIATVRTYFRRNLTGTADYALHDEGDGLAGTTEDGKPFALKLTAAGADRTTGDIVLRD